MSAYTYDAARAFLQSLLEVMSTDLSLNWGEWSMMFHWRRAEVDFDSLLGALHFWDPVDHVFRFGIDELCPTYEEFSWFLGHRVDLPQGVITPSVGPRQVLAELLSVDVLRIRYMFVRGGLDL